ncbi:MAG: Dna2/Cas4 domain-containing protein [Campylobacterales bacterium]|nr:Dna2/Cas4 domain-containing protein [Campylobacterales bacterium]
MSKLEAFINKNLPEVLAKKTADSLGDRSKYIGASDIGSCLRKAYLSKMNSVEHDIAQHIVFQRGHIAEEIVALMLDGTPYKQQVEVGGKASNGFDIKAHIDFVVDFGAECVVIEAKSTSIEVDEPYESWILQVQMQMGLLQSQRKGKKVRGYVIAINVNTGWFKSFEILPNKALFDVAMANANTLANALVNRQEPEAQLELYCSKCAFKGDCPAIRKATAEELPPDIKEVVKKIAGKTAIEKEIKSLKKQLQEFMEATGIKVAKADTNTVSLVTRKGKKTVDTELLKEFDPELYKRLECDGDPYSFLKVV